MAHVKAKKEMISLNGVDYFPKQFARKAFLDQIKMKRKKEVENFIASQLIQTERLSKKVVKQEVIPESSSFEVFSR